MTTGNKILVTTLLTILALIVSGITWAIVTDEYEVRPYSLCTVQGKGGSQCQEYKIAYGCAIKSSHYLAICDEVSECNRICEQARNSK